MENSFKFQDEKNLGSGNLVIKTVFLHINFCYPKLI